MVTIDTRTVLNHENILAVVESIGRVIKRVASKVFQFRENAL